MKTACVTFILYGEKKARETNTDHTHFYRSISNNVMEHFSRLAYIHKQLSNLSRINMLRNSPMNTFSYVETWSIFPFKPATGDKKPLERISILESYPFNKKNSKRWGIYMPTSSFWSTRPWTSWITFLIADASFSIESNNAKWDVIFWWRMAIFLSLASTEHLISLNDSCKHSTA